MLPELQMLVLSLAALLLFVLFGMVGRSRTSRTISKRNESSPGPPRKGPKMVTLGYVQSVFCFRRLICNPRIPNYEMCARISKDCGDVVIIRHPFKRPVTMNISDMSVAKSLLSSWVNRLPPDHYLHSMLDPKPLGIMFGNGGYWKEGRKLTLKLLQQFGFFREEIMEKIIQFEARELLETEFFRKIRRSGNKTVVLPMQRLFQVYALNVVHQVVLGSRFEPQDPNAQSVLSAINSFNERFNPGTSLLDVLPWLRHVPFVKFHGYMGEDSRFFKEYFQKELVEPRRKSGTYRTNPVDLVDYFLREIDQRRGDNPCYLNDSNFAACMRDLLAAGMETTNSTLEFAILHVCLQPGIQRKVQAEIDQVIGSRQEPCFDDRKRMPYTEAVLLETLRYATPVAMASRCPLRDQTILDGQYEIPKDSIVAVNLHAIHQNPQVWTDPEEFHPERFLNEQQTELMNVDKIIPFGYGTRACFGKFVAEINLFIFFVSLLQKFTFELSEDHGHPCMKNRIGLSHGPSPYYVEVSERGPTICQSGAHA